MINKYASYIKRNNNLREFIKTTNDQKRLCFTSKTLLQILIIRCIWPLTFLDGNKYNNWFKSNYFKKS